MKKIAVAFILVSIISFICSCGPSAEEKAAIEKARQDSTIRADSIREVAKQDSIRRAINQEVDSIFINGHSNLDEPTITSNSNNNTYVEDSIYNNTEYVLTVRYSSDRDSKIITLNPGESGIINLDKGTYREAASVNASEVMNFAGISHFTMDGYEETFYIRTEL